MEEFLKSEKFKAYHMRMIAEMNECIIGNLNRKEFAEAKGAFDMAQKVIGLPMILKPDNPDIEMNVDKAKKRFQSNFILNHGLDKEE